MTDTVIKVENVSKQYRLGLVGTGTISHDLNRWWARIRGKADPTLKVTEVNDRSHQSKNQALRAKHSSSDDYVWALKDINFEVKQGEVLGIIGRNGAGKSTLLKILSRVTAPTTGEITGKGRIASLLEVGTGFHPELTGRENIYLNGAINGMTKAEVKTKLDEIVEFSGCERYIDTPVKRYSSGMTVRLGFAVAAHLEPEILIVDEVLAVGDAEFQKKCIGKMKNVAGQGRTVLFVSHNMDAVNELCSKGMILDKGAVESIDYVESVTRLYLQQSGSKSNSAEWKRSSVPGQSSMLISSKAMNSEGAISDSFLNNEDILLEFTYRQEPHSMKVRLVFCIYSEKGQLVLMSTNESCHGQVVDGINRCIARIPSPLLTAGKYRVGVRLDIANHRKIDVVDHCMTIEVTRNKFHQMGTLGIHEPLGMVHVPVNWSI